MKTFSRRCALAFLLVSIFLAHGCSQAPAPPPPPPVATLPPAAATTPAPAAGGAGSDTAPSRLTIATFNLEFFGDTNNNNNLQYGEFGANVRRGDPALADGLAALVDGADIIGLQEVENAAALQGFLAALNRRHPQRHYAGYLYDTRLPQDLALVWDARAVTPGRVEQIDRRFRMVAADGRRRINFARLPITGEFVKNGVSFSVMVVHLKAKSSTRSAEANARRAAECARLLDWLDWQKEAGTAEHCVIVGDFNDAHSRAATELTPLLQAEQAGRLRFLTADFAAPAQYTNFGEYRGRQIRETIDHIVIPAALAEHYIAGSIRTVIHNDPRLSDHNPVLADFNF